MIGLFLTVVFMILGLLQFYKKAYERPKNFPPGPPRLPVYGGLWILMANGFRDLAGASQRLAQKYKTKILGFYYGPFLTIIVEDSMLIKEMLNRTEFDGRNNIFVARLRSYWKKLGIFFTDGYFWQEQRRFSFRYIRDYGLGRRHESLETVVSADIKEMLDIALNGPKHPAESRMVKGDLVCIPYFITTPFINGLLYVLTQMTVSRPNYKELIDMNEYTLLFQRGTDDFGGAITITPWLRNLFPNWSGYNQLMKGNNFLLDFFRKLVEEAIATHNESYDRHFLDIYIKKMKQEMREKDKTTFSVDQLVLTCVDFTFPAASAPQSVLSFLLERILLQPEIQDKVQEEIDRVVGRGRLPNLDDRTNMPYTEACIREAMRYDTLVPLGVPHRAVKDTTLGSYDIPENTAVSANFVSLHMDKELWDEPELFKPERFLKDGKLNLAADKSLPFGASKRLCAGETYSRQVMFQVFAALLQSFTVSTADGLPLKKPAKRIQGIITTIPDFWIRVTPRA